MKHANQQWAGNIFAGDPRAIARAISAIEKGEPAGRELLKLVYEKTGRAFAIGVTGSPGAGKSTLVEKLAANYRASGVRVGILAVDPTSPFSGGAILGDRIRMQSLSGDDGVYIRSMATRGQLGGLAAAAHDAVSILDAAGCGAVIVETVGVGQDEVEVARLADVTLLLLIPGMGDDVQTFKAGVMEIADLFVINKSDRPGAERVEQELLAMLAISTPRDEWQRPVLRTVATTGEGIPEVRRKLEEFHVFAEKGTGAIRRHERCRARLLELFRQDLFEKAVREHVPNKVLEARVDDVLARRREPHSLVKEWIEETTAAQKPHKL
ncbi:MAG: methylmalonyl Co-A mutase-associated GTPase MeaB [Deltaproteobacteria bacterium]